MSLARTRKNRKQHSRKQHSRKQHSRKQHSRKQHSRKQRNQRNRQSGGGVMEQSLAQGRDFLSFHTEQHGGALTGAPVGDTGVLDAGLRGAAGLSQADANYAAASGMSDAPQKGGRRNRSNRNKRNNRSNRNKRNNRSNRNKRNNRSNRNNRKRQSGGSPAAVDAPTNLLTDYSKAGLPSFKML